MLDRVPGLLHGGDYNPDQWLDRPDILSEDIALMTRAGVNYVSLGIFAWSSLEPEEGRYTFEWLDETMDRLYENGIFVGLATPSGGKPPWMIKRYPDIMRMNESRVRLLYGDRENHCNSSEIYREKVRTLDEMLAKRYASHPALVLWHISNEMYGQCHCSRCQQQFRAWLQAKYGTIDALNGQYWTSFWSHCYTSFDEIESPAPHGEKAVHGLALDYARFYSDLSCDFLQMEIDAVRKYTPHIPVTTNMFHLDAGIDSAKLAKQLDIASWDSYPRWHCGPNRESEWQEAAKTAFAYTYCRSLKKAPFLLLESTPSTVNNSLACKLKRPGMHMLSAMQAIAFGSDAVAYFQWRKSRGAYEKFHGAVVSHGGGGDTRVFRDVEGVGRRLQSLAHVKSAKTHAEVALVYDWDNMRILKEQKSLKRNKKDFEVVAQEHHEALLKNYVSVDFITRGEEFGQYKLVIAPVQYIYTEETSAKIRAYVKGGGHFVTTFYSGLVNENDLVYQGFPPHGLGDVLGLAAEETDCLEGEETCGITFGGKVYAAVDYCDILRDVTAKPLAVYDGEFYRGTPAATVNTYGAGSAYYVAFRSQDDFLHHFYQDVLRQAGVRRIIDSHFVPDVMVAQRGGFTFLLNFATEERTITEGQTVHTLAGYEAKVIERALP